MPPHLLHHKRENHNRLKSLNYFRISLSGLISFQYLDIGAGSTVNLGYDATGGLTSLGIMSFSVATTDLVGSLRITSQTESIDLIGLTFGAQDFNGVLIIPTTSLSLPNAVDIQIP